MSLNFATVLRQADRDQPTEPAASFERAPFEQTDPGNTAMIAHTAGNGGKTRGASLSHLLVPRNADTQGRLIGESPEAKR